MKEAYYYESNKNKSVDCTLCPHRCHIPEDAYGRCRVRLNKEGRLYALNYGQITALAVDPIEKKPLRHFHSGHNILSLGSYGCNFACDFCQNWSIAKGSPETIYFTTEDLMTEIKRTPNNIGLAYTYNEPTIYYEFMLDTAKQVHEAGYKNVMVSNGFINKAPLMEVLPYIDAFNIDLKAFNDDFYQEICGGQRSPVMETIDCISGKKHLEITVLLIDGLNTNPVELEALFEWIGKLDVNIPVHLSRYFPAYKMTTPATKLETLLNAKKIADKYLNYVYLGNVPLSEDSSINKPQNP